MTLKNLMQIDADNYVLSAGVNLAICKFLEGDFSESKKHVSAAAKIEDETSFELNTWLGTKNKIKTTSKEDFYVTINKKDLRHLTVSLEYNGPIKAPVKKGEQIAYIIVSKKDTVLKKLPLYAAEDLKKVNFFKSLLTSVNYLIWGDV